MLTELFKRKQIRKPVLKLSTLLVTGTLLVTSQAVFTFAAFRKDHENLRILLRGCQIAEEHIDSYKGPPGF